MRKRFYILFVARDAEGQLRKIPIPLHYLYVFLAGALIGMFTITGMAGSYARMLFKVASFNQLRTEKTALQSQFSKLEQVNHEKDVQVASLGSIANEVSVIYGLKPNAKFLNDTGKPLDQKEVANAIDSLYALRSVGADRRDGGGSGRGADAAGVVVGLDCGDDGSDIVAGDGPDHRAVRLAAGPVQRGRRVPRGRGYFVPLRAADPGSGGWHGNVCRLLQRLRPVVRGRSRQRHHDAIRASFRFRGGRMDSRCARAR